MLVMVLPIAHCAVFDCETITSSDANPHIPIANAINFDRIPDSVKQQRRTITEEQGHWIFFSTSCFITSPSAEVMILPGPALLITIAIQVCTKPDRPPDNALVFLVWSAPKIVSVQQCYVLPLSLSNALCYVLHMYPGFLAKSVSYSVLLAEKPIRQYGLNC